MRCLRDGWLDADEVVNLVRDAQRGAPHALDALLASLRVSFVRFFARRLRSDGAEDLAQVALTCVAGALRRIDPDRAGEFVVTVAENRLRSEQRHRARQARQFVPMDLVEAVPARDAPDREAETNDVAHAVQQACRTTLPPHLREIVLGVLRGRTQVEIAAEQRVPTGTIRTRFRRARTLLRVELARYRPEPRSR
jgi:RNA polymerase sigma-70 factor (ECF subfamily)